MAGEAILPDRPAQTIEESMKIGRTMQLRQGWRICMCFFAVAQLMRRGDRAARVLAGSAAVDLGALSPEVWVGRTLARRASGKRLEEFQGLPAHLSSGWTARAPWREWIIL